MRRSAASILVLLGAAALSCTPPPADTTEDARAGITRTNEAFMAAVADGDAAGVAACYTENGEILPPNAPSVQGRAEIEETFAGLLASGVAGLTLESSEIEGHGDSAYEVGRYELRGAEGGVLDEGKYIVIWKQVGEEWKLHRDIWNSNQPPPPAAEPAQEQEAPPAEP